MATLTISIILFESLAEHSVELASLDEVLFCIETVIIFGLFILKKKKQLKGILYFDALEASRRSLLLVGEGTQHPSGVER